MAKKYVPIAARWDSDKFRMWRLDSGYWIATQPLRCHKPMFTRSTLYFAPLPATQFVSRDPRRVLHEMQLAMAKAAA